MPLITISYTICFSVAFIVYIGYVHLTRFSRINGVHALYAQRHGLARAPPLRRRKDGRAPTRAEYPMTPSEAQMIMHEGVERDMPFMMTKSLEFALFLLISSDIGYTQTYGIESISAVLLGSKEFIDQDKAGRRYVDTSLLIGSFLKYPLVGPGSGLETSSDEPLDPRGAIALARINLQHSHYKAITNSDMLYTLCTFIREPTVWAKRFEWRPLTPLEELAWFVFMCEIGRRMGIVEIPTELQDLLDWAETYEEDNMHPSEKSRRVAEATTELLLFNVPAFLKPLGKLVVITLLSERLRAAIMAPRPPAWLSSVIYAVMTVRTFLVRHLCPPRLESSIVTIVPDPTQNPAFPSGYRSSSSLDKSSHSKNEEEHYAPVSHPRFYANEPWYTPVPSLPSLLVQKTMVKLGLLNAKAVPGDRFKPDGYRLETMGPVKLEGHGVDEVRRRAEIIHGGRLEGPYAVGGMPRARCPFAA